MDRSKKKRARPTFFSARSCLRPPRSLIPLASLATVALVLGQGCDASAIPLSSKPAGPGVHYFGYINSGYQDCCALVECPSGDYTACIADHANISRAWRTP